VRKKKMLFNGWMDGWMDVKMVYEDAWNKKIALS
jgi:hypothetical protein